uniref:Exonuclease domain-containing protein n=1 Tax=Sus scrofa TaxID=9823 RepID=A0A8D1FI12_PIG
MATASPAADGGRGRPWEGGLVSWPPAPPLTLPWTWMDPSWGQHPGVGDAERPPRLGPGHACGVRVAARILDTSGWSMLAPLQTGAARFSSYLLSRARKVLGSHLFSPCGVPEFCSISTRKLAAHGFGASMAAMVSFPPQRYHYFLVLDFEVTEIIEFPILKLNGWTMEIESTFHVYVRPVVHPQLTPFCTGVRALGRHPKSLTRRGLDANSKRIFIPSALGPTVVRHAGVEDCGHECGIGAAFMGFTTKPARRKPIILKHREPALRGPIIFYLFIYLFIFLIFPLYSKGVRLSLHVYITITFFPPLFVLLQHEYLDIVLNAIQ